MDIEVLIYFHFGIEIDPKYVSRRSQRQSESTLGSPLYSPIGKRASALRLALRRSNEG